MFDHVLIIGTCREQNRTAGIMYKVSQNVDLIRKCGLIIAKLQGCDLILSRTMKYDFFINIKSFYNKLDKLMPLTTNNFFWTNYASCNFSCVSKLNLKAKQLFILKETYHAKYKLAVYELSHTYTPLMWL